MLCSATLAIVFRNKTVQEAIAKANTLIEALGYIQRFRGMTIVIKMCGSVMDN